MRKNYTENWNYQTKFASYRICAILSFSFLTHSIGLFKGVKYFIFLTEQIEWKIT